MDILMTIVLTCFALILLSLLLSLAVSDKSDDFYDIFAPTLAWVTGIVLVVGSIALLSIGIYIDLT